MSKSKSFKLKKHRTHKPKYATTKGKPRKQYKTQESFCRHWRKARSLKRSRIPNPVSKGTLQPTGPTARRFNTICASEKPDSKQLRFLAPFAKHAPSQRLYKGRAYYDLLVLVYLLNKHKSQCAIFPKAKKAQQPDAHKYEFTWKCGARPGGRGKLTIPPHFWHQVNSCCKRLVVCTLLMWPCKGTIKKRSWDQREFEHGNFIIIDRENKTVEQIDPIGQITHVMGRNFYDSRVLEGHLRAFFEGAGYAFKGIGDWKRKFSIQQKQEAQEYHWKIVDWEPEGGGYCSAWAAWLADVRLSYPDENPDKLLERAIRAVKRHHLLVFFINGYIEHVVRKGESILKRYNHGKLPNTEKGRERLVTRYLSKRARGCYKN